MTTRDIEDMRPVFEAYILTERGRDYLKRNSPIVDATHDYVDHYVQEAWEAWQACSKAASIVRVGPNTPNNDMVICPACTSQFHAIPVNVQSRPSLSKAGAIIKPTYDSLKYKIERAIEGTSEQIAKEYLYNGKAGAVYDLAKYGRDEKNRYVVAGLVPFHYARELVSAEKKIGRIKTDSLKAHPLFVAIDAYVKQYKQLAANLIELRDKVVAGKDRQQQKRDAVEQERQAKFTEYKTLVDVLRQHIDAYVSAAGKMAVEDFDRWMAALENNGWDLDKVAPMPTRDDSGVAYSIKMQNRYHFKSITDSANDKGNIRKFSLTLKAEYIVRERDRAHAAYMAWIYKMIQKIGQPVDAATMTGDPWMNSVVSVTCRDGSKQVWNTKMKINRSKFGIPFQSVPLIAERPMSGGTSCKCSPRSVVVLQRKGNQSAFNGYRWQPSQYSRVECTICGAQWRTKAAYVDISPDK